MSNLRTHTQLFRWLVSHGKATFVLMCVSFIAFGVLSVNLVSYVVANTNYLLTYRWAALIDGGIEQMIEIWLSAFLALGCYLCFKLCEHALIERIAHHSHDDHNLPPLAEPTAEKPAHAVQPKAAATPKLP
jgi:hypothetical protein